VLNPRRIGTWAGDEAIWTYPPVSLPTMPIEYHKEPSDARRIESLSHGKRLVVS